MPAEPKKPLIVISYAHADEPEHPAEGEVKWLSFVTGYLRPAIKHGAVDLWLDRLMPGGADWEREIGGKLRACDIFILLVSRHSLSSDYVVDKEIAIIRERQAKGEDVHFYPLALTPTPKVGLDLVRDKNLRPRDDKPLSDFMVNERYRQMNEAADEIAKMATGIVGRRTDTQRSAQAVGSDAAPDHQGRSRSPLLSGAAPIPTSSPTDQVIASIEDGKSLELWLRGQPREVAIAIATRAALRVALSARQIGPNGRDPKDARRLIDVTAAIFRGTALARVARKFPTLGNELRAAIDAINATAASDAATAAAFAAAAARASDFVAFAAAAAVAASRAAASAGDAGDAAVWAAIRNDADAILRYGAGAAAERPLWSHEQPIWAAESWAVLRAGLPKGEDWNVWIDWYEERLRGGSRGEAYELVFASVPLEVWDKGPANANAWIRQRLGLHEKKSHLIVAGEIRDAQSLQKWLSSQPDDVATQVAARAALRTVIASKFKRKSESIFKYCWFGLSFGRPILGCWAIPAAEKPITGPLCRSSARCPRGIPFGRRFALARSLCRGSGGVCHVRGGFFCRFPTFRGNSRCFRCQLQRRCSHVCVFHI